MPYAELDDVKPLIPAQVWSPSGTSQPTAGQAELWLDDLSKWIDTTLTWRYVVPVTNDADLELLRPICASLAAAKVLSAKSGFRPDGTPAGAELRREALAMLAYDARTGRSQIALSTALYATEREAALSSPVGTFTDPANDLSSPPPFSMGMEF